jgi:hypothetical protein
MENPMPNHYTAWESILQVLFSKKSYFIPIIFEKSRRFPGAGESSTPPAAHPPE